MEPYVGQIQLFGFNFAPPGWATCEGQMLQIAQNTALYSLLGTTYGGDGRVTFALPDLRNKEPVSGAHLYCLAGYLPASELTCAFSASQCIESRA